MIEGGGRVERKERRRKEGKEKGKRGERESSGERKGRYRGE